ncbi:hypothetical protein [Paenibacillus kribbensis]|uniref:hypothetical protein n=1 Tax=Paenibacillus kribbensis TaxID=172713 RepID=UPI0008392650|nr:hypothetical protein [Paenibacillus kribbensis]
MSVKDMTDQQLNKALAEFMGYTVVMRKSPNEGYVLLNESGRRNWYIPVCKDEQEAWEHVPDYCNDPIASLEVQVAAIRVNAKKYFNHLERRLHPGLEELPESETWSAFQVAELVRAKPRQRAEAAYMTLSSQD